LSGQTTLDQRSGVPTAKPEVLAGLSTELKGSAAGASARMLEVHAKLDARDYTGAKAALSALKAEYPAHPWSSTAFAFDEAGDAKTLAEHLDRVISERETWDPAHPDLWSNPPPAADAPKVRITTDAGAFTVALYPAQAPKHVENFLKLCREGYYAGISFHKSEFESRIVGGDPNTKGSDAVTWGRGGPGYGVDTEESALRNFAGALGMEKLPGETQSSGSQFYIVTKPMHRFDQQRVVFGTVIDGLDVVQKIASAPLAKDTPDRPEKPAVIQTTEVL
jgi:cyclophilin family peptidyl-prolyl cis-trans isomerase